MKIQFASDLHLEHLQRHHPGERLISPVPGADVLILAGDIAKGADACRLFANWSLTKSVPIIYVAGNHEFYENSIESIYKKLRTESALFNIHFLENRRIDIRGVRFLGCTLWTDYLLYPSRDRNHVMEVAQRKLNDHTLIRFEGRRFSALDALTRHEASRSWLERELGKPFDGKTVVVTHHGPHPASLESDFTGDDLSAAFVSDLSEILPKVDLFLHGHVHQGLDYQVGRCRIMANPAGYVLNRHFESDRDKFDFENDTFDKTKIVVI